ncbi:non-homologous end-joining DNA ligase [Arsenicicoccus dermatophilus]|uniref:non-homologous end-joining DNA ligase n=1 Tax=Arsenicicoccus dermatophilus TaxID=1076331 RepID=UPI0039175209
MRPMLATAATQVPTGPDWVHEVKWDGMRVLASVAEGAVRLRARSGADATVRFPELGALAGLGADVLLDGEVVTLDGGRPSFGLLAERIHVASAATAAALAATRPITYVVFDVLRLGGHEIVDQPWSVRRELLDRLDLPAVAGPWIVPEVYADGAALHEATRVQGLEGVVSKRRSSTYRPGTRSRDWLKSPHRAARSVVVGGWRPETGTRDRLGAVLVGTPAAGGLRLDGRVGSGLAGAAGDTLRDLLEPLAADESPFTGPLGREDAAGARWVRPEVVVEVRSLGRGAGGRLRQPAYLGVRTDLGPDDLTAQED